MAVSGPSLRLHTRSLGAILGGSLMLGYVACLALVTSSAGTLAFSSWITVTAIAGALLVTGIGLLRLAMYVPKATPARCPIDAELWRIIDEENRSPGRHGPRR